MLFIPGATLRTLMGWANPSLQWNWSGQNRVFSNRTFSFCSASPRPLKLFCSASVSVVQPAITKRCICCLSRSLPSRQTVLTLSLSRAPRTVVSLWVPRTVASTSSFIRSVTLIPLPFTFLFSHFISNCCCWCHRQRTDFLDVNAARSTTQSRRCHSSFPVSFNQPLLKKMQLFNSPTILRETFCTRGRRKGQFRATTSVRTVRLWIVSPLLVHHKLCKQQPTSPGIRDNIYWTFIMDV